MSRIATFHVMARRDVTRLASAAASSTESDIERGSPAFYQALTEYARELDDDAYNWSGRCMEGLLRFVRWRGVRFRTTGLRAHSRALKRVCGLALLTARPRAVSLARLNPDRYDEAKLARHFLLRLPEFEEAGLAAIDGLQLLHEALSGLGEDEVLMVLID